MLKLKKHNEMLTKIGTSKSGSSQVIGLKQYKPLQF